MSYPSEGTFFSSPPSNGRPTNPADEVPMLISQAQQTTVLSPSLAAYLAKPKQKTLFLEVFSRNLELLKSRSQSFDDGHVTVYDKALLMLTRNGNDLENPAAIHFYCEEFLNCHVSEDALAAAVTVRSAFRQAVRGESPSTTAALKVEPSVEQHSGYPTASPDMEPKLNNLWNVYQRAKSDYLAVAQMRNHQTRKAAYFLRDTAENIQTYLKGKATDPIMKAELNATFNMANNIAISLSGGKKRKFDVSEMEYVRGTPRGPSNPGRQRYGGQQVYSGMRRSRSPMSMGSQGLGAPPGGPFPFGYSRPVDSYHPNHPALPVRDNSEVSRTGRMSSYPQYRSIY